MGLRRIKFSALLLACMAMLVSLGAAATRLDERLERLEQQLRLNPVQKEQFDVAVAATKRALFSSALTGMEFKERLQRELSKSRPDLGAIFEAQELMVEQNKPLFRTARAEWVKLYELLDEEQVKVARAFVEKTLLSAEALAEAFRRFLGQLR